MAITRSVPTPAVPTTQLSAALPYQAIRLAISTPLSATLRFLVIRPGLATSHWVLVPGLLLLREIATSISATRVKPATLRPFASAQRCTQAHLSPEFSGKPPPVEAPYSLIRMANSAQAHHLAGSKSKFSQWVRR